MNKSFWKALEYARDGMFVPAELTNEMLDKVSGDKVLVLYSFEMLPLLHERGYTDVVLVTDNPKKYIRNLVNKYGYEAMTMKELQITMEEDMKFDLVIGNPPFQNPNSNSSSGKLWGRFVEFAFESVDEGGIVAMITPNSWTKGEVSPQGNGKLLKLLSGNNTLYVNNRDCGKHFPNVGVTFSYFITQKGNNSGPATLVQNGVESEFDMSTCRFIPKNLEVIDLVHKFFSHEAFDNTLITNTRNHHIDFSNRGKTEVVTNGKLKKAKRTQYDEDPKVTIPWANTFDKVMYGEFVAGDSNLVFPCEKNQMENLIGVLTSKLYQFCNDQLRMAHHNEAARMFPAVDINRSWTDEELYAHFGLTEEEIAYVE